MSDTNGTTATAEPAAPSSAAAPESKPQGFGPVAGVSKDRDGRVFDASKYLPEKDANGRWKRIVPGRPGRPAGSKSAPKPAAAKPTPDFSDVHRVISEANGGAASTARPIPTAA